MRFKTSIRLTLLLSLLAAVFIALGSWQLQRKAEKQEMFRQFADAPQSELSEALLDSSLYAQVHSKGQYDPKRHLLLDNRIHEGRAGVEVLSLFYPENAPPILVNRGWLAMAADRRSLPVVESPAGTIVISGILNRPPEPGPRLGETDDPGNDDWPKLMTWFEADLASRALDIPPPAWIIQLDKSDPSGFQGRDWSPAVMPPATHGAYALQWFSLALAAFVIWIVLGVKKTS